MILHFLLILILLSSTGFSAPKYPFPVNADYPNGIRVKDANSSGIQDLFDAWLREYYEEQGDLARIRWDNRDQTVSEGIGYGMLIMVYMDNSENDTQGKFDKLWNYYKNFSNDHGLMNWRVNGFDNVDGQNAATDAELDAAVALMMAYKQWDDDKYLTDAKQLITNIHLYEINDRGYIKPGDAWDDKKNPSYFSLGALELYKQANNERNWDDVINKAYELLEKARNPETGLVPDWCSEEGEAIDSKFYSDALRTPWRMAWSYVWYGHTQARENANLMADWIQEDTQGDPGKVNYGYELDGRPHETDRTGVVSFLGAFTCAGMADARHSAWLNEWYQAAQEGETELNYYTETLQILYLLLLSGNFQNFYTYVEDPTSVIKIPKITGDFPQGNTWYSIDGRVLRRLTNQWTMSYRKMENLQGPGH